MAVHPSGEDGTPNVEPQPFIIRADTIEDAAKQAESLAFKLWRKEDGWQNHEAYIVPRTAEDHQTVTSIKYMGPFFGTPENLRPSDLVK